MDNERFKLLRRNSLRNEVDGSFEELEEYEDRHEVKNTVTHSECLMLNRVMADKDMIPPACRLPSELHRTSDKVLTQPTNQSLVRRLSGGFPGAFNTIDVAKPAKKELGGTVSLEECRRLAEYLTPSVGGLHLLPGACSLMMKDEESQLAERFERENAQVYKRLKRRQSMAEKTDYPPTMC